MFGSDGIREDGIRDDEVARHVAHMSEKRNACKILVEEPEGKIFFCRTTRILEI